MITKNTDRDIKDLAAIIGLVSVAILILLCEVACVMIIWNWLIVKIFGLISISFVEAFLLRFLAKILFRGDVFGISGGKKK